MKALRVLGLAALLLIALFPLRSACAEAEWTVLFYIKPFEIIRLANQMMGLGRYQVPLP